MAKKISKDVLRNNTSNITPASYTMELYETEEAVSNNQVYSEQSNKKTDTKSERLNLLLYPKVKDDLKILAEFENTSVNDLINKILKDYTMQYQEKIELYNKFCEEKRMLFNGKD